MYNPDFIEKIIVPFNILGKTEADILANHCQNLKVTVEFFLLAAGVLTKESILNLNLVKNGNTLISHNEVISYFDIPRIKNEIRKIIDKNSTREMPMLPQVGDIIDKYVIREVLGKGATATVYKAYHLFLKIEVALKVLSPQLILAEPNIQEKFLDEAMHSARVAHQNIVKIFDADKRGKFTYIVMEYINGKTIDSIIKDLGAIKPADVIKIVMELCKVLETASSNGLIHRDIKPGNIMVSNKSEVKLADFGLAKIINEPDKYQTISGKIYGTPYYMSPEQFMDSDKADIRSDLYSLGVTMYHMVTGKLPFETNSISKIIYMHLNEKPVAPATLSNKISTGFSNLIMKLMEKEPEMRYQNYHELYLDLKDLALNYKQLERKEIVQENQPVNQKITINMNSAAIEKFVRLMETNPNNTPDENSLLKELLSQAGLPACSQHS